jgi:dihydroorotase
VIEMSSNFQFSSKYLRLPVGIDLHVHFREPGLTYKESLRTGKKAAYLGGLDTVIDMPNTIPPIDNYEIWKNKNQRANQLYPDEENRADTVKIISAIAMTNNNTQSNKLNDFVDLTSHVKIVKIFMANSTGNLAVDEKNMHKGLEKLQDANYSPVVILHAEDPKLIKDTKHWKDHTDNRPVESEINAINKAIELKDKYDLQFHVTHVSSGSGAEILSKERRISWDTLPKYLCFNTNDMERLQNFGVMNPPLRSPEEHSVLLEYFYKEKIPIIASDHAPHSITDKENCVSGAPGVQELYPFLIDQYLSGKINLQYLERVIYSNANKLLSKAGYNISRKVLYVNPRGVTTVNKSWIHSKCKWSLWEGQRFRGIIMRN